MNNIYIAGLDKLIYELALWKQDYNLRFDSSLTGNFRTATGLCGEVNRTTKSFQFNHKFLIKIL